MKQFLILSISLFLLGCIKNDDDTVRNYGNLHCGNTGCGKPVIINSELYNEIDDVYFNFINHQIADYCLELILSAGGCDGSTLDAELIDADVILESHPVQRNLRLQLVDNEHCNMLITDTVYFDVSNIAMPGETVILNIENFDTDITIQ